MSPLRWKLSATTSPWRFEPQFSEARHRGCSPAGSGDSHPTADSGTCNAMKSTIDTGSQWRILRQISKHDTSVLHPAVKAEAPTAAPTSSYDSYPTSRGDSHPTAEAGATPRPIEIKTWATCQVEALAKTTQVSTDTLTDSDDAHLTVQLL